MSDAMKRVLDNHAQWLTGAGGERANLRGANLSGADLREANLREANLRGADLFGANLRGADLREANLREANLRRADLRGANLCGADLYATCLDPENEPNADVGGFEREGEYIIGYRSRKAGHIDKYRDGRFYSADVFSTSDTECHPGLYLAPSIEALPEVASGPYIKVRTLPSEVHKVVAKWRCRWFEVLGDAALNAGGEEADDE